MLESHRCGIIPASSGSWNNLFPEFPETAGSCLRARFGDNQRCAPCWYMPRISRCSSGWCIAIAGVRSFAGVPGRWFPELPDTVGALPEFPEIPEGSMFGLGISGDADTKPFRAIVGEFAEEISVIDHNIPELPEIFNGKHIPWRRFFRQLGAHSSGNSGDCGWTSWRRFPDRQGLITYKSLL